MYTCLFKYIYTYLCNKLPISTSKTSCINSEEIHLWSQLLRNIAKVQNIYPDNK